MRQLRFNYSFSTGYVQPWPLLGPYTLNFFSLQGLSVAQTPTQDEVLAFTPTIETRIPYNVTFPVSSGEYLNILVPAQFGLIDNFTFATLPIRFNTVPSNDQDALATNGTNAGEPYFVNINGVQYAYNFYQSQYVQHGTNIVITVNPGIIPP